MPSLSLTKVDKGIVLISLIRFSLKYTRVKEVWMLQMISTNKVSTRTVTLTAVTLFRCEKLIPDTIIATKPYHYDYDFYLSLSISLTTT